MAARPGVASIARVLATASMFVGVARAQVEGPLDNDSTLPIATAAEAELARGDQAWKQSLSASGADRDARRVEAFEAWRNALVRSRPGDGVTPRPVNAPNETSPWPAIDVDARGTLGVEAAADLRLAALDPSGLALWSSRFDPLASEALARAGADEPSLARVERDLPATLGAAGAALALADLHTERGELELAGRCLERARRHASRLQNAPPALLAAIERRAPDRGAAKTAPLPAWTEARDLVWRAGHSLEAARGSTPRSRALGSGPQPGLAALDDGRLIVQTPTALWTLSADGARVAGPFEPDAWLSDDDAGVPPAISPGPAPGWRLDPIARGQSALVVLGRSLGGATNRLARIEWPVNADQPRAAWVLRAGPVDAAGAAGAANTAEYEFQPGPAWTDDRIYVLVRRSAAEMGELELELRALSPADGSLLWTVALGKGGERTKDLGRFARRGAPSIAMEPLVSAPSGIFIGTPLGFATLVDPLDGRIEWGFRCRRRGPDEPGWTGWGASGIGDRVAWAPADSDQLYALDLAARRGPGAALAHPPLALGEAEGLVDSDADRALVFSRSGARWALTRWDLRDGARQDALRLGPEEVFGGRGLTGGRRVFAASDRALYLFDAADDLRLLAAPTLRGPLPRGGNVHAAGSRVFVLSSRYVEVFEAR